MTIQQLVKKTLDDQHDALDLISVLKSWVECAELLQQTCPELTEEQFVAHPINELCHCNALAYTSRHDNEWYIESLEACLNIINS